MAETFDYEILNHCTFELTDSRGNSFLCWEPATHKVWWADDMSDTMLVCPEHFFMIKKREVKDEG